MADGDVKLRVTIQDGRSINELSEQIKALTAQWRSFSDAQRAASPQITEQIRQLKDLRTAAMAPLAGEVERTRTAYFTLGAELRGRAVPATMEFSRIIQDMPFGLRGVVDNVAQMVRKFGALSAEAGGAGGAMKAMLSTLSGPMGIALGITAVTSLAMAFGDKLFPKVEETRESVLKLDAVLVRLGDKTKIDQLKNLVVEMNRLQQEADELAESPGFLAMLVSAIPGLGLQGYNIGGKAAVDAAAAAAEARSKVRGQFKSDMPEVGDQFVFGERPTAPSFNDRIIAGWAQNQRLGRIGIGNMGDSGGMVFGGPVRAGRPTDIRATFGAADRAWLGFASSVNAGIDGMVGAIGTNLSNAFASVFGGAGTMIGAFVARFTQALQDLAARAAAIWLFEQIPYVGPIIGAWSGSGAPGGGGSVVPSSSDMMTAGSASNPTMRLAKIEKHLANLNLRVDSRGLYLATEAGRYQFARTSV